VRKGEKGNPKNNEAIHNARVEAEDRYNSQLLAKLDCGEYIAEAVKYVYSIL